MGGDLQSPDDTRRWGEILSGMRFERLDMKRVQVFGGSQRGRAGVPREDGYESNLTQWMVLEMLVKGLGEEGSHIEQSSSDTICSFDLGSCRDKYGIMR